MIVFYGFLKLPTNVHIVFCYKIHSILSEFFNNVFRTAFSIKVSNIFVPCEVKSIFDIEYKMVEWHFIVEAYISTLAKIKQ